jgi:hypothetical protein
MILAVASLSATLKSDELYVINGSSETLSMVDLETEQVTNDILTLGLWPNDILIVRDTAYIVNSGTSDIFMYDLIDQQVVREIYLGASRNPWKMAQIAPDTFLVTNWLTGTISKFTSTGEIISESPISGENPQGIVARGDTCFITTVSFVWQDTSYDHGFVVAWDSRGDSTLVPVQVGENPSDLTFGPNGDLYVVCTGEYDGTGSVYVLDPDQMVVLDSILIGGDPTDIEILPDNIGFLAAGEGWWPPGSPGHVLTFDAESYDVLRGPSNPILTGAGVMSVTIASDSTVFSLNFADDSVTELDSAGTIIRTFAVGDGAQVAALRHIGPPCEYARGDADGSGGVDIDDVVYMINYIFGGGDEPACGGLSGDVDCSDNIDIDDVVYLIEYIFGGGPAPCDY